MLRTWDYQWWKPPLGILLAIVSFFVIQVALTGLLAAGVLAEHGTQDFARHFADAGSLKDVTPWTMLYVNLGLASLTLVAWFVVRVVHGMRFRWLVSVLPGVRWRFFFASLGLAVVALGASLVLGAFLPGDANGTAGTAHVPTGQLLVTAIVILVTTPLQAMGEEFGFRGYLMQAFGSFMDDFAELLGATARAARIIAQTFALLLTSACFALAHGTQNFPLFFDRFVFGLMAGLVVILVGGLEAGIALHILNNLVAFGVAIAYDQLDSTLTVSEASWWQIPITLVQNGIFLLLVVWLARRMGLRNKTAPPPADGLVAA